MALWPAKPTPAPNERPDANLDQTWPGSSPAAFSLPLIQIANISAPGVASANANFHRANDFIFQETQSKLRGRHAFRYGVEFLRQFIQEQRAANDLGSISYTNSPGSPGYSAFANFLDDFSGPSGTATRVFGSPVFYPNQLHQSYFFEDNWKATRTLAITLGLRYENFGQFANSLPYPAFSGFDPSQFLTRHTVSPDNKDFGPAFGLAWSPGGKTVWRGGYQVSYDSLPTQLIALGPATTSPNAITTTTTAPNTARGLSNWFGHLPESANAPGLMDTQNPLAGNLRNPYTERWSLGFQRELPAHLFLDVS